MMIPFAFVAGVIALAGAFRFQASEPASTPGAMKPSPRSGHCLVYDGSLRTVVLLDGYQPPHQPERGEVWAWDGKSWALMSRAGPPARSLSGAAYDSRRRKIVLYGGIGNKGYEDLRGDIWEWDGKDWRQVANGPIGTRDHHVVTYDAARGRTLLYGGISSSRSQPPETWKWTTDTWEWDGATWTRLAVPGPGGRAHFAMVYDEKRKETILFGGRGQDGKKYGDTWAWDGKAWRQVSVDGPAPRARHRMAFDGASGFVVLYGGAGDEALEDTWVWDGHRWSEVKTAGPGKRLMHAMAYDVSRGRVVLYGGSDGERDLGDTWEWDGKRWQQVAP